MEKRLHFEIVSRYQRKLEPAVTAVPFSQGELAMGDLESLLLTDRDKYFPLQAKPTALWPDGSIKWLLTVMQVDLPANEEKDIYLILDDEKEWKPGIEARLGAQNEQVKVIRNGKGMSLENGEFCLEMAEGGSRTIFERIRTPEHTYEKTEIQGPVIVNKKGDKFTPVLEPEGWEILEAGPIRAIVRAKGKHVRGGKSWFDFSVTLTVWAGKPWINLDYQFINREKDETVSRRPVMEINNEQAGLKYNQDYAFQEIRAISLFIEPSDKNEAVRHGIYTSSFNFHGKKAVGTQRLREEITADTVVSTANEMFPEVLFSIFVCDWDNQTHALSAGIYQAYQNFPKALESSEKGIRIDLVPDTGKFLKVPQGAARTSRCYLYFHKPGLGEHELVDRAHQFEMPPIPVLDIGEYIKSGVLGKYVFDPYHPEIERFLYRYVDSRAKGLGMMHFGDGPEWEYIKQGRSKGKLIWINNEYDMPHNFMIMLARSGDRRYFDYMKAAVEHWYDVDICHYSEEPYRQGLLYTHSIDHVSGQPVPSHQWVEGFLDYYHMTGNVVGYETAMSIGEGLLKLMELPLYHAAATVEPREIGWAMRTFVALYKETGEERWLDACRPIVKVYIQWAREWGNWMTPYPDNYMDRVPFMIHVGIVGLYQYYEITGEQEAKSTILAVIDDMIRHCYIPRIDMFFGKQHPAVRFQNLNGMVLESMAIAYELTGNKAYIEKGLGMFSWITIENPPPVYDFSKYKEDDFTVIYNCPVGPKRCAQTLLPLLHYYRHALELGYLDKEKAGWKK